MTSKQNILISQRAVIVNDSHEILLYQRQDDVRWELPGGIVNQGESLDVGFSREVLEEVGANIYSKKLFDVSEFEYSGFEFDDHQKLDVRFVVVSYQVVVDSAPVVNSREHQKLGWFSITNLTAIKIHDNSVSALSKWREK